MEWIVPKIDWESKDFYNYEDLNRVENNIQVISYLINTYITDVNLKLEIHNIKSFPFPDILNRIENNINILKVMFHTPLIWEENKTNWRYGDGFSYKDAHRLENNLLHLYLLLKNTIDTFAFCGPLNCGEDVI